MSLFPKKKGEHLVLVRNFVFRFPRYKTGSYIFKCDLYCLPGCNHTFTHLLNEYFLKDF